MNILFISPHLDDVALSCSKSISSLRKQGFSIYVLTVFANSAKPSASGDRPWEQVSYLERQNEDKIACENMGAHVIHLDFLDAPYRLEEFKNFNSLFSHSAEEFTHTTDALAQNLSQKIEELQPLKVFCPLGIGWHIDHLITYAAVDFIRSSSPAEREFFYYEDRPYVFIEGALELRLNDLGYYPADGEKNRDWMSPYHQAAAWVTSPMARSGLNNLPQVAGSFFTSLHRNIKSILKSPSHAALHLLLPGNTSDLDYARKLATDYKSQFDHLFGGTGKFLEYSLGYASRLAPGSEYAERMWIL